LSHDIDVVYSTNHLVHPVSKLASLLNDASLVTFVGYSPSQHEAERRYSNPLYLLEQVNFRFMLGERVYCRDPTVRDIISAVSSRSTAQIVHGILNEAEFRAAVSDIDSYEQPTVRALADAPDTTLLMFVGKLSRNKRPELAVQILSELPDRYELVVVGDGEQRAAAEATARRTGTVDRVHFIGELSHVRTLQSMLLADGLLLTSMTESYSAVVLEALACSCAAFSTPVGVVPEIADEVSRLHVCEVDAMACAILDADPLQSVAVVDERVLEMFPVERFTGTICESFEKTTGLDPVKVETVTATD
jgi:glycosyltransferase involved in cell wall biosynthesis